MQELRPNECPNIARSASRCAFFSVQQYTTVDSYCSFFGSSLFIYIFKTYPLSDGQHIETFYMLNILD